MGEMTNSSTPNLKQEKESGLKRIHLTCYGIYVFESANSIVAAKIYYVYIYILETGGGIVTPETPESAFRSTALNQSQLPAKCAKV